MALHEAYGSPAELEAVKSDLRCKAVPKGKAKGEGTRMMLESHAYILVAVPAGFPLGLLQDV